MSKTLYVGNFLGKQPRMTLQMSSGSTARSYLVELLLTGTQAGQEVLALLKWRMRMLTKWWRH